MAQAFSKKIGRLWSQFDLNFVQAYLNGASGKYLDYFGAMLGLPRLGEVSASVTSTQKLLQFYVDIGYFGDINSGNSIYLPAGTIISSGPTATGTKFRLTGATYLLSSEREAFVSVQAIRTGTASNLGVNQLIYHDFTTYTDSFNNSLKVRNIAEISTGQSTETDINYKYRLANQVIAAEQANLTAIRLAALVVPGVADIITIPYFRGIGSFELLIKATTPTVSSSLLSAVAEAIYKVQAYGLVSNVRGPVEIGMGVIGAITFRKALSTTDKNSILSAVTQNVTDYINNLDIAEDFIVNEMVERVMATSDQIKNIGSAGTPFNKLYIFRPSALEDNKIRSTLVGDFTPSVDEKLLVENKYGGETPILFSAA